jgi:hypothetical protein
MKQQIEVTVLENGTVTVKNPTTCDVIVKVTKDERDGQENVFTFQGHPQITIIGRRWFSRTYGNTYHSCVVLVDGEEVGRADYVYGYGDGYLQTAHSLLQEAGIYPKTDDRLKDYHQFRSDMQDYRHRFQVNVQDVDRKRDL